MIAAANREHISVDCCCATRSAALTGRRKGIGNIHDDADGIAHTGSSAAHSHLVDIPAVTALHNATSRVSGLTNAVLSSTRETCFTNHASWRATSRMVIILLPCLSSKMLTKCPLAGGYFVSTLPGLRETGMETVATILLMNVIPSLSRAI